MTHTEVINYLRGLKPFWVLARNILFEAGNQSEEGQRAVAAVTLNRAYHPSGEFGKSIVSVILAPKQFSWANRGMLLPDRIRFPWNYDPDGWARAKSVAQATLAGMMENPVDGAVFYHNPKYANQIWVRKVRRTMQRVAVIEDHEFFKRPGDPASIKWEIEG